MPLSMASFETAPVTSSHDGVEAHPSAIVDARARIGNGTIIGPHAVIGPSVQIGASCIIGCGAVIGTDGFGYERDPDGRWLSKPHEFGVLIGDDVHIGANTCVDRGSWRDTQIGRGTRVDNLVHVAHNVWIGEDAIVVAHAMLAGSVTVEAGAWIGPSASVMQRLSVGEGALVGMGAVVLQDVAGATTVVGNPARVINAEVGVRDRM